MRQSEANPPEKLTLASGKFLALIQEGHWEYGHRPYARGAVVIAALTDEQKLLLVEQYRIPVHSRTIELPAGLIGDEPDLNDEEHIHAAQRELTEETGYEAGHIEPVLHGSASTGIASETLTMYVATKLRRIGPGGGVGKEDIKVHEVPLNEVHEWLQAKAAAGIMMDPKVYAGLYFLMRKKPQENAPATVKPLTT